MPGLGTVFAPSGLARRVLVFSGYTIGEERR
jgi:hypothetical protein